MPSTRRSGSGHGQNPAPPSSEMAPGGGTNHQAVGGGFDAQKLMSWSRFSQGNGSRIFSHRAWCFLHGDLCPLEVPVWAYRKDLCLKKKI